MLGGKLMKKQKTIAIALLALIALMIVPFVSAQAPTDQFSIAIDGRSPVSDVILATDVATTLDNSGNMLLFSEIDATEIEDDAVLAIYNNEAIIILGEDASSDLAAFIVDVGYYLDDLNIEHETILSNEVTSSDFRDLFVASKRTSPCGDYGDVDMDGYVTEADANLILKYSINLIVLTDEQIERADVTANGKVTSFDAAKILKYANHIIDTFQVCDGTNFSTSRVPPCGDYGDVDFDNLVTQLDVNMVADIAAGLIDIVSSEQMLRADVSGNGKVTGTDASKIARYLNGEIDTFPVCSNVIVDEQITCVFKGSNELQKCYTINNGAIGNGGYGCFGVETCIVNISGNYDSNLTWESSCEEYYSIVVDGHDNHLKFVCSSAEVGEEETGASLTDESNTNSLQAKNQKGKIAPPILTKKGIMVQEMTEEGFSQEIRPLYNYNGAQTRFLQLHKALVKAIVGQKEIISYIGDEYPEADIAELLDLNSALAQVFDELISVDIESYEQEELTEMYVNFKGDAQELIALFKEEAHAILGDDEVIQLREQVRNINTEEMKTMSEDINQYKLKYNAGQVRETLEKVGIDDANLLNAVETGAITYGQIRSEIANRYNDLTQDVKKQVILKMKEAKVKAEVKSQKIVQSMNLANGSEIAKQVRNRIATSVQSSNARQGGK